jgi:hypothetical protein
VASRCAQLSTGESRCTTFTPYPALPSRFFTSSAIITERCLTAGAAEGDSQITLALVNVVGEQVNEQIGDARDEFACLGKRADIFRHAGIASGQRTEFGNEVRIGKETHVEYQVGVLGNALPESEAHAGNQDVFVGRLLLKTLGDMRTQLVNVEFRSVDNEIGDRSNGAEVAAFGFERRFYGGIGP